jgi:hypothetical protein
MNPPDKYKLNRSVLETTRLNSKANDRQYWLSKLPTNASKPSKFFAGLPMATIRLPGDFSEFLKLLNSAGAEYLPIGGYAVNYYGSSRSTGDMEITSISGVDFEECYNRRELAEIEGMHIPVIRLEDLQRNKRASGRCKDLADLDELQ